MINNNWIIEKPLNIKDYFNEYTNKCQIVLHHTASGGNANSAYYWWTNDKEKVGTAFVIGRDDSDNGKVYRFFNEGMWAYHLGTVDQSLNKISIGIEICNWGFLTCVKGTYGFKYFNWANTVVPENDVVFLEEKWRGVEIFQKYTTEQLTSVKNLIQSLANEYNIDVCKRNKFTKKSFDLDVRALKGTPGLYFHSNYRKDKTDAFPQIELLDMLNEL